jgi:hypothetical protein
MGDNKNDPTDILLSLIRDVQTSLNNLRTNVEKFCINNASKMAEYEIRITNLEGEKKSNEIRIVRKFDNTTKLVMIAISLFTVANFIKEWFIK